MQFLWPFKSEYIIVYVDPSYQYPIIGRTKRDYLWIMARSPEIDAQKLAELINIAVNEGYDREAIQMVPQRHKNPWKHAYFGADMICHPAIIFASRITTWSVNFCDMVHIIVFFRPFSPHNIYTTEIYDINPPVLYL